MIDHARWLSSVFFDENPFFREDRSPAGIWIAAGKLRQHPTFPESRFCAQIIIVASNPGIVGIAVQQRSAPLLNYRIFGVCGADQDITLIYLVNVPLFSPFSGNNAVDNQKFRPDRFAVVVIPDTFINHLSSQ